MKRYLKTALLTIFSIACLTTTTLSAWYDPTGYWGKRYPNYYDIPSRGKYTVRAEMLYLRPHVDNVKVNDNFIQSGFQFFDPNTILIFTNNERARRFKWKPGWKVGVGYACNDCWEADLNWTHYSSKAYIADFLRAETDWKLHLDMIDLEVGKEMWFRNCLRIKPFAGIRFAQIKQRYEFDVGAVGISPFGIFPFDYSGKLKHNYLAGGPRIGFDSQFCLGCGFHFFLTGAAAWIWGEMQNRFHDNVLISKLDKDHHWEGTGITDISCGLGWSDLWYNERRRLTFRFGYEHHWFIHQNKFDNEGALVRRNHTSWFVHGIGGSIILDF